MTETDKSNDRSSASDGGDQTRLTDPQRGVAGGLGLIAGLAGAAATFMDGSNAGGAPLLIGVGALFGYLALTGQTITSLKIGGAEAALARAGRLVETAIENPDIPPKAKAQIAEAARDERLPLSRDARRAVDAVLNSRDVSRNYERSAMEAIHRVRPDLIAHLPVLGAAEDAVLSNNLLAIPVTIKMTRVAASPSRVLWPILDSLQNRDGQHLLIVDEDIRSSLPTDALQLFAGRLLPIVWHGPAQDNNLRAVLDQVFGPARIH